MKAFTRRSVLMGGTALMMLQAAHLRASEPFSHQTVIEKARALAQSDYAPRPAVPQDWQDLSYDMYRQIWFRSVDALWSETDKPFNVDFFHPGLYFPRPVAINVVENGQTEPFAFDYSLFDHTDNVPDLTLDESLGYSGFRLRSELTQPGIKEEFCVFQGASYFRAIGVGQIYGLSGRGLALKTADPEGEEFPEFIEFWLETPSAGQRDIIVHALLDSPSVSGAYEFRITPGENCVMDVRATLFPRVELNHVGLGALTSMFMFDETNRSRFEDFRTAVHDSDGLLVLNGAGETLWRPIANPRRLQISSFLDENPLGFGLMQRARRLSDFGDLEALYHLRPGLWVEPLGDWGKGAVTLVEIPTIKEVYDNIVAYWRPSAAFAAGSQVDIAYRLTWSDEAPALSGHARVLNTRLGRAEAGDYIVTVDFEAHPDFEDGPETLDLQLNASGADVKGGILQHNPETGGLRLGFRFDPDGAELVEMRAQLRKNGERVSEVWLYRWTA